MSAPVADPEAIAQALDVLFEPDDVIELRAIFSRGRKRTDAGYFGGANRDALIREAVRLNKAGAAVYVNLNSLDPQLLARYANRVQENAPATATDANVTRRRWLLLDFDPVRPKDTSATKQQLAAAKARLVECYRHLHEAGWPDPMAALSGNGFHLLYRVDLPNDTESRDLIKAVLETLARRFDDDAVKIDMSVFNAGRIVKLYGTVANKGDNTSTAPWRLSRVVRVAARENVVAVEKLRALAPKAETRFDSHAPFDLENFLSRLGIEYERDTHEGRERFKLAHCPFNREHGRGEAAVFRDPHGVLGFKCQHSSCAVKTWQDLRELVDGPKQARAARVNGSEHPKAKSDIEALPLTPLAHLLDEPDEQIAWLVQDHLPSAGTSLLAAKPKVGKSTLARNLALCVARGNPWLGFAVHPGAVFYLALEEKRAELRRQFRRMGATNEDDILIFCEPAPEDALPLLWAAAQQRRPALIVVDPLGRFSRVRDFSDYAVMTQAMEPLVTLARETGAHLLLVHHEGKMERSGGDGVLGSTALFAAVDTLLVMRRTDRYRTLYSEQRYGANIEEMVLSMDQASETVTGGGSRKEVDEAETAAAILEYLKTRSDPVDEGTIHENVEGRKKLKVTALRLLLKDGKVIRSGGGKKGDPYLYASSPKPEEQQPKPEPENSGFLVPTIYREPKKPESENGANPRGSRANSGSQEIAISDESGTRSEESGSGKSELDDLIERFARANNIPEAEVGDMKAAAHADPEGAWACYRALAEELGLQVQGSEG